MERRNSALSITLGNPTPIHLQHTASGRTTSRRLRTIPRGISRLATLRVHNGNTKPLMPRSPGIEIHRPIQPLSPYRTSRRQASLHDHRGSGYEVDRASREHSSSSIQHIAVLKQRVSRYRSEEGTTREPIPPTFPGSLVREPSPASARAMGFPKEVDWSELENWYEFEDCQPVDMADIVGENAVKGESGPSEWPKNKEQYQPGAPPEQARFVSTAPKASPAQLLSKRGNICSGGAGGPVGLWPRRKYGQGLAPGRGQGVQVNKQKRVPYTVSDDYSNGMGLKKQRLLALKGSSLVLKQ